MGDKGTEEGKKAAFPTPHTQAKILYSAKMYFSFPSSHPHRQTHISCLENPKVLKPTVSVWSELVRTQEEGRGLDLASQLPSVH